VAWQERPVRTAPRCPVCDGASFTTVIERPRVPVHQNLVLGSEREALEIPRGDLTMVACQTCGFVFNRTFDAGKLLYGAQYDNTQLASSVFQDHVNRLVRHIVDERGVRNAQIVEVGCGKGAFLRALVTEEGANNRGMGFDPSYVGPNQELGGRLRFERRFYDATCTDVPADAVVCRHVMEHVPEPLELLRAIFAALAQHPGARLFLETPCVACILKNDVVWDFFYEHCSLFTARSLTTACERAGFTVDSVDHVFGGQYLWLEATNRPPDRVSQQPGRIPELSGRFAARQAQKLGQWQSTIRELAGAGRLALWGAAAKGVTFANLVDPDRAYFECLVDINPAKQGGYVAGTGHPIIAPAELAARGVSAAVLLNPNYRDEITAMLREQRLPIDVLDLGAV
jgi:SAM-dependent methyltransferase